MSLLIPFCVRMLATALLVIVVARVAERAGPFLASTVLTLPLFAGPSFFFLMYEVPAPFIAEGALYAFGGTGAVLAFAATYVLVVRHASLPASLVAASLGWAALAVPLHVFALNVWIGFGWCALGAGIAYVMRRPVDMHGVPATPGSRWLPLVLRALVAGAAVATVSVLGALLGPKATGIVVAFPITISVSAWLVHRQYGSDFSAAVLTSTQRTLLSYSTFCLSLALLARILDVKLAFWLAVGAAALSAAGLAWFGTRARRRQAEARR